MHIKIESSTQQGGGGTKLSSDSLPEITGND